jgi:hypothetical protein
LKRTIDDEVIFNNMKILQERFYPSVSRVLALAGDHENNLQFLIGYDVEGNQLFHVTCPNGYSFLYLSSHLDADVAVVCGTENNQSESWPDFHFSVDHESGALNRICRAK